jgi:uncharacterized membrane protein YfcA
MLMLIEYLLLCLVALLVAGLTLFSGFGLGTLLMPAFALFFPVPVAVAATAVVHLANNLFKLALVGRHAVWPVVVRFGLPAALAAVAGAATLTLAGGLPPLATYTLGGAVHQVTPVKLVIGLVIVAFALLDLLPPFAGLAFDQRFLPLGGLLSGFFGGLSGNQGALRSAFLIKAGLDKEQFIGTGVVAAVIVDGVRLVVYGAGFYTAQFAALPGEIGGLVLAATVAAFVGSFLGARLIKAITLTAVQRTVGALLVLVGLALAAGLA